MILLKQNPLIILTLHDRGKKNIGEFFVKKYNKTICTTYVQLGRKNHRRNRSAKSREITRKAEQETTRRQLSSGF